MKTCRSFDENIMASYIDNKLSAIEKEKFEKHLFSCDYCLKVFHNLKNEIKKINITKKNKFIKVPESLLNKGIQKLNLIERAQKIVKSNFPEVFIKLYEKGMKIIKALNTPQIVPVPVAPLRDTKNKNLLTEILVKNQFENLEYKICLNFYKKERIKITLNFFKYKNIKEDSKIILINKEGKIIKNFAPVVHFECFKKDLYKIKLNETTIGRIVLK